MTNILKTRTNPLQTNTDFAPSTMKPSTMITTMS